MRPGLSLRGRSWWVPQPTMPKSSAIRFTTSREVAVQLMLAESKTLKQSPDAPQTWHLKGPFAGSRRGRGSRSGRRGNSPCLPSGREEFRVEAGEVVSEVAKDVLLIHCEVLLRSAVRRAVEADSANIWNASPSHSSSMKYIFRSVKLPRISVLVALDISRGCL